MNDRRSLYENAKPKGGMRERIPLPDMDEAVIAYGHACRMDQAHGTAASDRARRGAFKRYQRAKREWEEAHEGEMEKLRQRLNDVLDPQGAIG